MADYSMDDGLEYDEQEEQPEPQPAAVVEPVAPTPPAARVESVESIKAQIQKVRDDPKLSNEKRGAALEPLYRRLVAAEKGESAAELQAADPVADAREVESSLRNTLGFQYDEKITGMGQIAVDLYGKDAEAKVKEIGGKLSMPIEEQLLVHHQLIDAGGEGPGGMSPEQTVIRTGEKLLELWGDRADEEHGYEVRGAELLGGVEKVDAFIEQRWPGNHLGRIKFRLALAKIGRRIKTQN